MTFDPVNKPSHYTEGREFETIDVIEDWGLGFHLGNAVKYISRAGCKDPDKLHQDISKAIWYLERYQDMHAMKRRARSTSSSSLIRAPTPSCPTTRKKSSFEALGEIPSSVQFGVDDDIYAAQEVPFTWEPEDSVISSDTIFGRDTFTTFGKDLSKFEDHGDDVIVSTFIEGDFMVGKRANGDFRIVGRADGTDLYEEVLKADPLDLAPSEFEPMHDA